MPARAPHGEEPVARVHESEKESRRGLAECLREHLRSTPSGCAACALLVIRPSGDVGAEHACEVGATLPPPTLAILTERVQTQIRGTDHVVTAPVSGALAIVLRDADSAGARAVAGRLCMALDSGTTDPGSLPPGVRLSLGYSSTGLLAPHDCSRAVRLAWRTTRHITVVLSQPPMTVARQRVVDAARITPADALVRRATHGERRGPVVALERGLREAALVEERPDSDALRATARALGVPYAQIPARLPAACRRVIAPELARALRIVPIGRTRGVLTVAMEDPRDTRTVLRLHNATGLTVFPVLADADEIERALAQLAGE